MKIKEEAEMKGWENVFQDNERDKNIMTLRRLG